MAKTKVAPPSLTIGLVFDDSLDRPDGVQQQVRLLSEWLSQQGHEVHLLVGETKTYKPKKAFLHSLSSNIKVSANQNTLSLPLSVTSTKLQPIFDEVDFDVLHVMLPFSPFLGRKIVKLAQARSIPLVGTFHTYPSSTWQRAGSWLYGRLLRRDLTKFAALTTVTVSAADYVRQSFGVDAEVVPNFIEVSRFSNALPITHLKKPNQALVIFINRLVKRKGAEHLIVAASKLSPELKAQTKIIIGGKGPQSSELERLVHNLGVKDLVEFIGFVDEAIKPQYLASADIAVYPATGGEAFGIVLLEAMAAGAVTLGGDIAGYRDVLEPIPGSLFTPSNHDQLAEVLSSLILDSAQRLATRQKQDKYVKQFSVDKVGQDIETIYSLAVAGQPAV